MKKLAVLISNKGTGTNLQAIIDALSQKKINAKIAVVISDTEESVGLNRARKHNLPIAIVPKKNGLLPLLQKHKPDFVCLCGWKQIITDDVINAFANKILNLHPGAIPDAQDQTVKGPDGKEVLWNKGKLTDQAIQNFLDNHATYAGSSIHFLTHDFDFGPVLGRVFEKIQRNDTIEPLYQRLKVRENKLYQKVLAKLCSDMNILIIGSGGREHALANIYSKSRKVTTVHVAPGNGLIDYKNKKVVLHPHIDALDFHALLKLCKKEGIDLVDVAPDNPLAEGFVDQFEAQGISAFGPTKAAAQLEWDKAWARDFMKKYKLPIPQFRVFQNPKKAIDYIKSLPQQTLYIKAAGLAYGKGAIRAESKEQAIAAIEEMKKFGKSGETFLIEECLIGEEFSLFAICDGKDYVVTKSAQDHKTVYGGDIGPNTGGIGCISPVSIVTAKVAKAFEKKILKPLLLGMQKEGRPYKGILYLNGMLTKTGIKIVEFNCRWGDPEAEVILPSIQTDYITIVDAVIQGDLKKITVRFDKKFRISVAGCSRGYPGDYSSAKGKQIFGLQHVLRKKGVTICGAGIKRKGHNFYVVGGRIFHVIAESKSISKAREKVYAVKSHLHVEGNLLHYRTDIGWREIERLHR